jgi:predicted metal-dependent peptidase
MFIENFRDKNKKPFPKNATTETYYRLLMDDGEVKREKGNKGDGKGEEESDGSGNGQGKTEWVKVNDLIKQGEKVEFDSHEWTETEIKERLEASRDLLKRAMQKASMSHTKVPLEISEALQEINRKIGKLDYKAILLNTLKKSMPSRTTRKSWLRPNRRLGDIAPATVKAVMPKIEVLIDTSGSISIEEANEFLKIVDNFLNVGVERADIHLFHTHTYHSQRVKKKAKVARESFQSGGTDLTDSFTKVTKSKPDLVIVLTDGQWSMPQVDVKKLPELVFVISKEGTVDHPMKKIGRTVKYMGE